MSNRDVSGNDAETIIAASVKVEGDFVSQGNVLIEGTVEGSLRTERNLRIGERANISADVHAANASVAGEIKGNITVAERLELEPTARIFGDIKTKFLVVANGAVIVGRIAMGQVEEADGSKDRIRGDRKPKVREEEPVVQEAVQEAAEEKTEQVVHALFGR